MTGCVSADLGWAELGLAPDRRLGSGQLRESQASQGISFSWGQQKLKATAQPHAWKTYVLMSHWSKRTSWPSPKTRGCYTKLHTKLMNKDFHKTTTLFSTQSGNPQKKIQITNK